METWFQRIFLALSLTSAVASAQQVEPQITRHLDYMESELAKSLWFAGDEFSAADVQMSFVPEVAKAMVHDNCDCANEGESMKVLTEENVIAQLQHLRTHPSVASRLACGQLFIHGWVYDIETSEIKAYDAEQGAFRMIGDGPLPMATPRPRYLPS